MFAVEVRDHIMIAHSLPSPVFGPAQGMHGATFTVDAAFMTESIDQHGLVVDIGLATDALAQVLAPLRYKNLDEVPEFEGKFTTTEFLCHHIFEQMATRVRAGQLSDAGRVLRLRITLHESHTARAWYEGDI
ncbi:6-pyruvoyl trahydropterin synthase family protein [Roseinatronobacter bogoriensis]|uniref:6-carboxy-5,6,7,8-tetrahydropterin synthase n=1 Tax=Roseinatronobacter bogoriensis subsp. barguzinensis TaxID=441209 RepID=A0A2K8K5C3_9RHOB|nr:MULTISPECIES: 6-carboxytetrahydropterin synthase [Rhodobaca]ATX64654.1 6-carboxytetrahydropterin synthase [Rhodobaca barguzinensis]MBB4209508.1 6-pyruvoyl-tetrahydropterin synthase [Rhodobaca bogoriensis DSM 18756]TDW35127.1 6-pyruvoyl-tetrahydropterin synthase [Rhodobaca barguzinensis]TDY66864.1 6-pyruvoyl-tetrahydropterin synthase [Rhodobaca bogoriensis DSM 18756]